MVEGEGGEGLKLLVAYFFSSPYEKLHLCLLLSVKWKTSQIRRNFNLFWYFKTLFLDRKSKHMPAKYSYFPRRESDGPKTVLVLGLL